MFPILLTVGGIPVSSFGVFLALSFLVAVFLIWRLSRAWDLDEEKVLDLTLLTFFGGLIGARIYFVLNHLQFFSQNLLGIFLFNKFLGFSFWGGFLGGWLSLFYFARKKRLDFWQIADFAAIGFLGGLVLSNLGCFLGGCNLGIQSNLFLAVNMVGQVGKRFPIQIIEALLLLFILLRLWSKATHFHQNGKILGLTLIYIGAIKLLTEPWKAGHDEGIYLSAVLIILGVNIIYKITKRSFIGDLKGAGKLIYQQFVNSSSRRDTLVRMQKYWYNQKTAVVWGFRNLKKSLRRLNVRFSYKNH